MSILIFGVLGLIAFMVVVMGVPFVQYLRHDSHWQAAGNKSPESWYERFDH